MKLTLFPLITSTLRDAEEKTIDWWGLQELLRHKYDPRVRRKEGVPIFHPGTFKLGETKRLDENVARIYFGVLDFDAITENDLEVLCGLMDRDKLQSIIYTTWSNAKSVEDDGPLKLRLVIPFNRAVAPQEWNLLWGAMVARYGHLPGGSTCDASCKNIGRIYYLPYLEGPVETHENDFVLVSEGHPLNVDDLKDEAADAKATSTTDSPGKAPLVSLTPESLQPLLKRLKKSTDPTHVQACLWLPKLMKGAEIGFKEGEGHPSWLLLTKIIGEEFLKVPAEQLFEVFFQKSLARENQRVNADEQMRRAEVVRALAGAQNKALEAKEEERRQAADENLQRCKDLGLEGPYTEEQINKYAEEMGIDTLTLRRHLIFQVGPTYHIFLRGEYKPVSKDAAPVAIVEMLLPAVQTLGLNLYKVDKQGNFTRKTPGELVEAYGKSSYTLQFSTHRQSYMLDPLKQTIHAPLFPHPLVVAEKSDFVEGWLDAICFDLDPEKRKMLDQWLAWSVDLSMSLSLLLLTGPPDTGKSLFAQALATYWDRPCASADVAFDTFSGEDLCESPLIFADEHFPADKTTTMRSLLGKSQHRLNRKYQQVATILGHYRMIATANNDNILLGMQKQALTPEDVLAVAKRTFHIQTSEKAAEYLDNAGDSRRRQMLETKEFAKHVEYLRTKVRFVQPARFGTKPDRALMDKISVASGVPSTLMRWVVEYLTGAKAKKNHETSINMVRVKDGKLLLTPKAIMQMWTDLMPDEPRPSFDEMEKAFYTITTSRSGPGRKLLVDGRPDPNTLIHFRDLRIDLLKHWLVTHDSYIDPDTVLYALMTDTRDNRNNPP